MSGPGKVAVLMGGPSSEREISLLSGTAVLKALRDRGVDAHAFDPAERPLAALAAEGYKRVFIALHGRFGEDGTVQGALETMAIAKIDGVPRQRALFVLKKDGCVYDVVYDAAPLKFDEGLAAYRRVRDGLDVGARRDHS